MPDDVFWRESRNFWAEHVSYWRKTQRRVRFWHTRGDWWILGCVVIGLGASLYERMWWLVGVNTGAGAWILFEHFLLQPRRMRRLEMQEIEASAYLSRALDILAGDLDA